MPRLLDSYPLSPMQQGLLFHHLSSEHAGVDLEQIVCSLHEAVDVEALTQAWQCVVSRHAVLRTAFRWESEEEPSQDVYADVSLPVELQDWCDASASETATRLAAFLEQDRARGFDLREAPLSRVAILRTQESHYEVIWSFHHILLDGRSFPIVLEEVFAHYEAIRDGRSLELPEPEPYRSHIDWLTRRDTAADEAFWRKRLAGFASATALPAARSALGSEPGRGEVELRLDVNTSRAAQQLAQEHGVSLNTVVQAAWGVLLGRYSGADEVVFGAVRAGRRSSVEAADSMVGLFINTLPVRMQLPEADSLEAWLGKLSEQERAVAEHEHAPLVDVQAWSEIRGSPLFESILVFDNYLLDTRMRELGGGFENRNFRLIERTNYPLTLYGYLDSELFFKLAYDEPRYDADSAGRLLQHLAAILEAMVENPRASLSELSLLGRAEREQVLHEWNATEAAVPDVCVHQLVEAQAARTPEAVALVCGNDALSYRELDARANQLARYLQKLGVGPGKLVGLCMERSLELGVGLLAILKAGGAYLPLDPDYPRGRLEFILDDARASVLLTQQRLLAELPGSQARVVCVDRDASEIAAESQASPGAELSPEALAYVIYTSGSTGRPKGVMVEHRNVVNFFVGMDACIDHDPPGRWLAVTSLSFDISVLELLWTLARGFQVVVHRESRTAPALRAAHARHADQPIEMSLFYFASGEGAGEGAEKYRLLLEGARFADENGFAAVWTPERHFHAFGGLYPNPSVAGAALASITRNVSIRAGSVVLPLHHPVRVAEEWSLVDNLSKGRVGVAFASGWQPNDFVLAPDNYADSKQLLYDGIEIVRKLWRGEAVEFDGPDGRRVPVRTLPRPVQDELPIWVTSAGSEDTYRRAGEVGAYVLTHMLGQSLEDLDRGIRAYREAWEAAGHPPGGGHVTLMLHTFVGDDMESVRETVREPMKDYLRTAVGLVRGFVSSWTAYKRRTDGTAEKDVDISDLSEEELDGLLEYSFERYFETSALFGTPERCLAMIDALKGVGVDEVACLVDFGVDTDLTLEHLQHLNRVRELARPSMAGPEESVAALIQKHEISHLQCTPSMARMLSLDEEARGAFSQLDTLLVGGEAFPASLASELRQLTSAELLNMYGPTETTIWSSVQRVTGNETDTVAIGQPIANTDVYVLDSHLQPAPVGMPGELYIGGDGVTRGYLNRPELTAERFLPHPFRDDPKARVYRTGDLARWRGDGSLEFLGRSDHQVKIRGYRIELGEIESLLTLHPSLREAVVVSHQADEADQRLVAYVIAHPGEDLVAAKLREYLREKLPEFMIPSHFVELDAFPLTPNRKVDRKALPAPDAAVPAREVRSQEAPQSEIENRIAAVWKQVLHIDQVARDDSFFDLGGHSLLAVKAHRELKQVFPGDLRITDLFRFPTLRALARHLGDDGSGAPGLERSLERAEQRRASLAARRRRRTGTTDPESSES